MRFQRAKFPAVCRLLPAWLAVQCALMGEPIDPRLSGTPFLRVWAAEDYDAAPVNWRVLVHPNGLVYVGNNSGVLEFDGARWRTRAMANGGRASALAVDHRGRLWAGGHDEICVFEPDARGSLRAVDMTSLVQPADRPIGSVTRALSMPDGVYLQSQQRLFRFYEAGGQTRVQVWRTPPRFSALFALGGEVHVQNTEQGIARVVGDQLVPVAASISAETGRTTFTGIFDTRADPDTGGSVLVTTVGPIAGPVPAASSSLSPTNQRRSSAKNRPSRASSSPTGVWLFQ